MSDSVLSLLGQLVAIPSVTSDRAAVRAALDFLERSCNPALYRRRVSEDGLDSVLIALDDGLDFDVLILAHTDVVPAPAEMFHMRREGDRLLGRGTGDMKGPLCACLVVLNELAARGVRKKIGLLVVGDEETGGRAAPYWINSLGLKAKIVLDPDSGEDINKINEKSKRIHVVKITAHGERAHGATPWLGTDAIEILSAANAKLRALFPAYSRAAEPSDKWVSTAHIGLIEGGEAYNVIAPVASAVWDFRLTCPDDRKKMEAALGALGDGVTHETVAVGDAVVADVSNPAFLSYLDIVRKKTGAPVVLGFANGATDARYFVPQGALVIPHQPTCDDFHSDGEWLSVSALETYAEILREFLTINRGSWLVTRGS